MSLSVLPASFVQQAKQSQTAARQRLLTLCQGDFDMLLCMYGTMTKTSKAGLDALLKIFSGVGYTALLQVVRAENTDFQSACKIAARSSDAVVVLKATEDFFELLSKADEPVVAQMHDAFSALTGHELHQFFQKAA